jgi:hypothetical protein
MEWYEMAGEYISCIHAERSFNLIATRKVNYLLWLLILSSSSSSFSSSLRFNALLLNQGCNEMKRFPLELAHLQLLALYKKENCVHFIYVKHDIIAQKKRRRNRYNRVRA